MRPAALRSVHVPQRRDDQRPGELRGAGVTSGDEHDRPASGNHQEAVGAEAPGDVPRVQPDESGHGGRAEGHAEDVAGLQLPHRGLWREGGGRGGEGGDCLNASCLISRGSTAASPCVPPR